MNRDHLINTAQEYLDHFCHTITTRRLGTQGNRDATTYFQEQIAQFGFDIIQQRFNCIESRTAASTLHINGAQFDIFTSPFSLGYAGNAMLVAAENVGALENITCNDKILLLHGEIAKEQLMPKGFEFFNPEAHKKIYQLLEKKQPAAILTATSKNPDAVGAIYPFPMIEDGDFDIPNAFLSDVEGERLLAYCGQETRLVIRAERVPSKGENIIAYKRNPNQKIVLCAHIDTKENTPGALDNASGVAIMLLLGELLADYRGDLGVELAAFNGEEYYNTPGQIEYLKQYQEDFSSILLAINLDDIGYIKGRTAYSFYGVSKPVIAAIKTAYQDRADFFEGPPWYQSDHGIFMAKGVPAMAITEENVMDLMKEVTHTEKDTPAIVEPKKLVDNAFALKEVIEKLNLLYLEQKSF